MPSAPVAHPCLQADVEHVDLVCQQCGPLFSSATQGSVTWASVAVVRRRCKQPLLLVRDPYASRFGTLVRQESAPQGLGHGEPCAWCFSFA
jgi:hypothetical protein